MADPICPAGCDYPLQPVSFSVCAPETHNSEIKYIYVAKPSAAAFANWKLPGEWATRLDQTTTTGNDYIRRLVVIGDVPAPSATTRDISGDRTIVVDKQRTLNATIDETNQINYDFLRQLECGGQVRIWWETKGGKLYGGNEGVLVMLQADEVLNRGRDEIATFNLVATWRSKFAPERTDSPIAGDGDTSFPTTYDTTFLFNTSATPPIQFGVKCTAGAIDPEQKFEINKVTSPATLPISMTIMVGGVNELVVDTSVEYTGRPFRYTSKAGAVFYGQVSDGIKSF